jgi:isopentenyl diphosphate isomerase/L-lactate dehydrogenase-like FMN-dependent dehydrogenase
MAADFCPVFPHFPAKITWHFVLAGKNAIIFHNKLSEINPLLQEAVMVEKIFKEGWAKVQEKRFGGRSETGSAHRLAREYIDSLTIEMRVIDAVEACTKTSFWGHSFACPLLTSALSGLNSLWPEGMAAVAAGVKAAGGLMVAGIGDEAELKAIIASGAKTVKIVKPYKDKELVFSKLAQAEAAGAIAVGMDIDFIRGGKIRETILRGDMMGPQSLADIKSYVQATKLPFILKGILSLQDARKALEAGAGGIIVSHHGGMVMDYALPPFKILPAIAALVKGRIPVIMDGAIARGSDIFKALALGADGVMLGSVLLPGLAQAGAEGVEKTFNLLNEELRRIMGLTGSPDVRSIDPEVIWEV